MTVRKNSIKINRYIGASTDTKPSTDFAAGGVMPIGSTFYEYDTGLMYITYDGTNWVCKDLVELGIHKSITVAKVLVGGACGAEDVLSEHITTGTAWTFAAIARANGGKGFIVKAMAICETTALTPRLTLFLFNATPTGVLNDNVANTSPVHADLAKYVGKIDFPAMEDLGTGTSSTIATPSTYGNLPLAFECASDADDLYGVLVSRDIVTPGAAADMTIILTALQS